MLLPLHFLHLFALLDVSFPEDAFIIYITVTFHISTWQCIHKAMPKSTSSILLYISCIEVDSSWNEWIYGGIQWLVWDVLSLSAYWKSIFPCRLCKLISVIYTTSIQPWKHFLLSFTSNPDEKTFICMSSCQTLTLITEQINTDFRYASLSYPPLC